MINNFSDKDKKDWEVFIESKEKLNDKDLNLNSPKRIKLRSIDLHGYTLKQANQAVENFIFQSYSDCVQKLIVVTGKGLHSENESNPYVSRDLSILKYSVPEFILKNNELMKVINAIEDANIEDGGSGAFYIYLKKNK